ncbi:MAG: hypothetical protein NVV82_22980 [Sporocytophaga sp.]|nr:hypothetical protein [Sporocytophaga sp.]
MTLELTNQINEIIALHYFREAIQTDNHESIQGDCEEKKTDKSDDNSSASISKSSKKSFIADYSNQSVADNTSYKGKLLMDATVAPQDITYPTDLKLLNTARRKSEELIDKLYSSLLHGPVKPRTYRKKARNCF